MKDELRKWIPRWWAGEDVKHAKKANIILWPVEHLFGAAVKGRNKFYDLGLLTSETAPLPVISIGNIGVGGAGKTPFAAWVAQQLIEFGRRPAIVLRGYGADEVAVHAELNPDVPVITAAKRLKGSRQALEQGSDVVILDDAFQHRALRRDLDIVLVSVEQWQGNRRLMPRGPWREREGALARADLIIVTRKSARGEEATEVMAALERHSPDRPIVRCYLESRSLIKLHGGPSDLSAIDSLDGQDVLAIASLADPAPFLRQMEDAGANVDMETFPDHYAFTADDAAEILERAGKRTVVMTRKEAVKLSEFLPDSAAVYVLDQRVIIESGMNEVERALRRALERQIP